MWVASRVLSKLLVLLAFSSLPACSGSCDATVLRAPGETARGEEATTCLEILTYEGIEYEPWCSPVPEQRLGVNLASNFEGQFRYVLRPILGVELDDAVAIHEQRNNTCGRWRFAPNQDLTMTEARDIAQVAGVDLRFEPTYGYDSI